MLKFSPKSAPNQPPNQPKHNPWSYMSTQQITFDLFWIIHWSKRASTWMESWRGHCHIILGQKEERDSSQRRKKNVHQSVLQAGLIWFSRTPFGVLPITFDSDVQTSCSLMIWKANRMAYKYVSNSHLQRRLLRGSNCCPKLESDLCPNIYWNCVVFFFIDFGSLACKTYYFSVIQVISCLLKCSYI